MTERDRLAADLHPYLCEIGEHDQPGWRGTCETLADRLIALGWAHCNHDAKWIEQFTAWVIAAYLQQPEVEERLARALRDMTSPMRSLMGRQGQFNDAFWLREAAAIAKAYREDDPYEGETPVRMIPDPEQWRGADGGELE